MKEPAPGVGCLSEEVVFDFAQGTLSPAETASVAKHLDQCEACRMVVADAARVLSPTLATPLKVGQTVGRYLVKGILGVGGVGVVYTAHDPELHRQIALKVVRSDVDDPGARPRLLREAQAMARLSHPNVVTVYDVGTFEDQVFVAMELVSGQTLRHWLRPMRRRWQDVLKIFMYAGEGLAAAHHAGLIHRDFKPENVLLGNDGRVRVTDFGLARSTRPTNSAAFAAITDAGQPSALAVSTLTRTGMVAGTPAYMAPEQFRGGAADARTDQFSYCVALYEALYRTRPFPGTTLEELAQSVLEGAQNAPTQVGDTPAALWPIIKRGLSLERAGRFASMKELLGALESIGRAPRARMRLLAAGAALGICGIVGGIILIARGDQRTNPPLMPAARAGAGAPAAAKALPPVGAEVHALGTPTSPVVEPLPPPRAELIIEPAIEPDADRTASLSHHKRKGQRLMVDAPTTPPGAPLEDGKLDAPAAPDRAARSAPPASSSASSSPAGPERYGDTLRNPFRPHRVDGGSSP
jgi:serine/threonine protein kinase